MLVTVESGTSIARQADVVIDVADALQASGPDPEAIRTLIDRAV
jgi:hypothetical protein